MNEEDAIKRGLEEKAAEFAKEWRSLSESVMRMCMNRLNTVAKGATGWMTFKVTRKGEFGRAWRTRQDVRKYAAEHGIMASEAVESGMEEKRKEFLEKGSEVYSRV